MGTMGIRDNAADIIEHLKNGKLLDAFDRYYHENVRMQENRGTPTVGKAENRKREEAFLASVKEWKSLDVATIMADSDGQSGTTSIEYSFDFVNQDDQPVHYEQVAVQRWENGQIVEEKFYYDTGA